MQLSKFDIGAEILAILTKGMYPDPRDAVREYIQNSIDAKAQNVTVKVRQNSIVIEDDGIGMDYSTLRKAIRVGVSDKRPGKDVGFMGIGIYSAFHLCDTLTIYTRKKGKLPQILSMDFEGMRTLLDEQKEQRLNGEIKSEDLTDLQTLLQTYITLPDESNVSEDEYPISNSGTRIELVGLNPILDDLLNKFDDLASYLRDVVPLRFDKEKFEWAELIENKIKQDSKIHNANFELINLKLQVGSQSKWLYRPYTNELFSNNKSFQPDFFEIKSGNTFLGIAWGCLNSTRDRIKITDTKNNSTTKENSLRGFLIKKQGFSIGKREALAKYFGSSNTFFDRYTGEIIILNNEILPNASRNDLESSSLKKDLLLQIQTKVAPSFIAIANKFQEEDKAREVLLEKGNSLKKVLAEYNPNEDNYNVYLEQIRTIDDVISALKKKKSKFSELHKKDANIVMDSAEKLKREISIKFQDLYSKKKKTHSNKTSQKGTTIEIAENLDKYTAEEVSTKYDSLLHLIDNLGIEYSDEMEYLIRLIDEKFVQGLATSNSNYHQLLNELKNDFENQ